MKLIPGTLPDPLHGHIEPDEHFEDPGEHITSDISTLSDETIKALLEAGIELPDWQPQIVTESDAEHILAFRKFLIAGEWKTTEDGEKIYMVDQSSFDYATGAIDSSTYLKAPEGEKEVPEP